MSKCYQPCPAEVEDRVKALVSRYHADLEKAGVTFDLLFVADPEDEAGDKPMLSCHGVPALAIARIVPVKDRVKGCRDGEICIDQRRYEEMEPAQRDALLDHELQHFELKKKGDATVTDVAGRPGLRMRKHDYDFGWFEAVARRHGTSSIEVRQARTLGRVQAFFPFFTEITTPEKEGA